jgi:hypothetical protein
MVVAEYWHPSPSGFRGDISVPGRITNGLEKVATMAHQRENNVDV